MNRCPSRPSRSARRSADMWTVRLAGSTKTLGQTRAIRSRLLTNSPRLYFGAHLSMSEVTHCLAKQVVARPTRKDEEIRVELDGEVLGRLPATFEIVPRALRVRFP